jgi:hypothetical protein
MRLCPWRKPTVPLKIATAARASTSGFENVCSDDLRLCKSARSGNTRFMMDATSSNSDGVTWSCCTTPVSPSCGCVYRRRPTRIRRASLRCHWRYMPTYDGSAATTK